MLYLISSILLFLVAVFLWFFSSFGAPQLFQHSSIVALIVWVLMLFHGRMNKNYIIVAVTSGLLVSPQIYNVWNIGFEEFSYLLTGTIISAMYILLLTLSLWLRRLSIVSEN